jgi:hypothetical protein
VEPCPRARGEAPPSASGRGNPFEACLVPGAGGLRIRISTVLIPPLAALLALAPAAFAGTAEEPELADAADDCAFAPGNHYADVTAAWVSDETATGFNVNLQLSKWTAEPLGAFTGYTVQFEHQGVQFGVAAFFDGVAWEYTNAFIDVETGEMTGFEATTGSFTPGTPALLTVLFDKGHFPHGDAADNRLVNFQAATADFKSVVPWFLAPIPVAPPNGGFMVCDLAEGTGAYTFQVGGHSMHDGGAAPGNATAPGPAGASAGTNETARPVDDVSTAAAPSAMTKNESPGAGALGALLACVVVAALRRRA